MPQRYYRVRPGKRAEFDRFSQLEDRAQRLLVRAVLVFLFWVLFATITGLRGQ